MKFLLNLLLISLLACPAHATLKMSEPNREIYISLSGDDNNADGSRSKPFRNIQPAIDFAADGDVLIVLAGRYSGPLNRNLNFKGKAVILQSEFPDDNYCMNNTIIDAEGNGYIIRFINDEGPNSIFQGFSIVLGDTSLVPYKGIPGFVEFSQNARPTTKRLKIFSKDSYICKSASKLKSTRITKSEEEEYCPYMYDPFNQPFNITDYYGSGDVNKDGELDQMDLDQLDSILTGLLIPNIRADVDGSGIVDIADYNFIDSALYHDRILPGWWNQLSSDQEKNRWIDSIFKIDRTDQLTYVSKIFDCSEYARQIQINAFQAADYGYRRGLLDGGQTIYNLPIFYVSVNVPVTYGHAINGILAGDEPLNFDNWRFIEPQNDLNVYPGGWNMPYNANVCIYDLNSWQSMTFFVDETGWILDTIKCYGNSEPWHYHYSLNNYPFHYTPKLLKENENFILYEKQRDDMTRIMDIHLSDQKGFEKPLTLFNHYCRIWNVEYMGESKYAILWSTKTDKNEGYLCRGDLDINSLELSDIDSIPFHSEPYDPQITHAKFVLDSEQKSHVFWRGRDWNLYYSTNSLGEWSAPEIISNHEFSGTLERNNFDVISYNDTIVVFFLYGNSDNLKSIEILKYDGTWHEPLRITEYSGIQELHVNKDINNRIHLIYPDYGEEVYPSRWDTCENYHMYSDDAINWSIPKLISSRRPIKTPKLLNSSENDLYLVYQEYFNDHHIPVWQKYTNDTWGSRHYIPVRSDANTLYTRVGPYTDACISPDNLLYIAWASKNPDSIKIETYIEKCMLDINLGKDTNLFIRDTLILHAGSGFLTYNWSTGQSDSTIHFVASEMGPGSHVVGVTASDVNGCSASDEIIVTVECYTYPNFHVGKDTTIVINDTLMLNAEGGFETYSWSTGQTDSIIYINASDYGEGQHTFKVTAADAFNCSASDEITVTVECYTYPDFHLGIDTTIFSDDTLMLNAGGGFETYSWSTGQTDSIIYINASDYGQGQHSFKVIAADAFNCSAFDEVVITIVNNPLFIDQVSLDKKIKIYPNPVDNEIIIEAADIASPRVRLTITHLTGTIIYTNELNADDHNLSYNLDVSKFESGIFFIKIEDGDTLRLSKLIIE
jgi:hypothetical protein